LGLTRLQVARMLGLQMQNVSRLEKGYQPDVRISTADRLARLFGVASESLLK
jgi:transcriptional regulator with XRE-family HTH domain